MMGGTETITTYEIVYLEEGHRYMTTNLYKTLEECKNDIPKYSNKYVKVTEILKRETKTTIIPIKNIY